MQTERSSVGGTPSWGAHPPGFEPGRLHAGARPLCGTFPGRLWWHRLASLWPCLVKKKFITCFFAMADFVYNLQNYCMLLCLPARTSPACNSGEVAVTSAPNSSCRSGGVGFLQFVRSEVFLANLLNLIWILLVVNEAVSY